MWPFTRKGAAQFDEKAVTQRFKDVEARLLEIEADQELLRNKVLRKFQSKRQADQPEHQKKGGIVRTEDYQEAQNGNL